ncbi:MAG: ATP-binding protein [Bacteroidales bacterium]
MQERFQYPANIQQIPMIRNDLSLLADQWRIPGPAFNQIRFIVEELFSNIIRFGYPDPANHLVDVEIRSERDAIIIEITDDGVPFDPIHYRNASPRDPAAQESGGMGLSLVRTFADSIVYRRSDDKNRLEITKNLKSLRK